MKKFKHFIRDLMIVSAGLVLLLIAAEGIVRSASFFSETAGLPLAVVGILIVGIGNAIPETYFALTAARKGHNWLILGDLMGSVILASKAPTFIAPVATLQKTARLTPYLHMQALDSCETEVTKHEQQDPKLKHKKEH